MSDFLRLCLALIGLVCAGVAAVALLDKNLSRDSRLALVCVFGGAAIFLGATAYVG